MPAFDLNDKKEPSSQIGWLWWFLLIPGVLLFILWRRERQPGERLPAPQTAPEIVLPVEHPAPTEAATGTAALEIEIPAGREDAPPVAASDELTAEGDLMAEDVAKAKAGPAPNDLTVVEGIGPKTAEVLRNAGIMTFRQLADTRIDQLKQILNEAGLRLNPPDSWPEQARLAAEGQWQQLEALKNSLQAGRRPDQEA